MEELSLNQILYSIGKLVNTDIDIGIEEQLEFVILYNKTLTKLKDISMAYKESIKEYYSNRELTNKQINENITIEEKINLNFVWNEPYNMSCRFIKLSTQEEDFVLSSLPSTFFSKLNKFVISHKGIKVVDFRCREDNESREDYIKVINTINVLSQLKINNIKLK